MRSWGGGGSKWTSLSRAWRRGLAPAYKGFFYKSGGRHSIISIRNLMILPKRLTSFFRKSLGYLKGHSSDGDQRHRPPSWDWSPPTVSDWGRSPRPSRDASHHLPFLSTEAGRFIQNLSRYLWLSDSWQGRNPPTSVKIFLRIPTASIAKRKSKHWQND